MKKLLHALPFPACGVMLALAALGNLLQGVFSNIFGLTAEGELARCVCGGLSAALWLLLTAKLAIDRHDILGSISTDAAAASTSATYPMGTIMLLSYIKPILPEAAAQILWFAAVLLHGAYIAWFACKYILHFRLERVYASYFVVFVGATTWAITAPVFGHTGLGTAAFFFALTCLLCLFIPVTLRYVRLPVPEAARPLFCIYTSPAALCLTAYAKSVAGKRAAMVIFLLALSSALWLAVLSRMPSLLRLPFYPSYASFTFPFVITATAADQSRIYFDSIGMGQSWLTPVVVIETVIAACLVFYTLYRYIKAVAEKM